MLVYCYYIIIINFIIITVVVCSHIWIKELSNKDTISEIGKVLDLLPGNVIHCALFVLNGDDVRFTAEEQVSYMSAEMSF
jgi:uncharacterized membrane protein YjjP (DUF1212 family)